MKATAVFLTFFLSWNVNGAAEPLHVEDLLDAPTIAPYSPAAFSPDGRLLAYVVTDQARKREPVDRNEIYASGVAWFGIASDIWIADLETGESRNLTGGEGHHWAPVWSPDAGMLVFLADRNKGERLGPARLWLWDRAKDEIRKVSDADIREAFVPLHVSGDGKFVLVTLFPADLGREGYAAKMEGRDALVGANSGVTARVYEHDPAFSGEAGPMTDQINLDVWRRDLALIDVSTGEARPLTQGLRVGSYRPSVDGRSIAYTVLTKSERPGAGQYLFDLVVQDLGAGKPRTIGKGIRMGLMADSFSWSPDGKWVAWRTAGPLANDEVLVVPARGGETLQVASNPATERGIFETPAPVWDTESRHVFFVRDGNLWRASTDRSSGTVFADSPSLELEVISLRQQRLFSPDGRTGVVMTLNPSTKESGFARLDLRTGAVTPVIQENKRYGGYGVDPTIGPDGRTVAYVAEDPSTPADFYVRSGDLTTAVRATEVAPALGRIQGRAEVLQWYSIDGDRQRGALVYPSDYEEGKRYPLIVKVYGGSSISNDLNRFGFASSPIENLQLYATRGYALLLADSKLNLGTPMLDLMKSVMPGINTAVESGLVDADRIGVMGHSYGGYSTLALIAQSPRFRAAVMRAGMGNLFSGYGQLAPDGTNYGLAWAEGGQGRMGGSPWEYRERYLENSPIFYLDRVNTPLLIIHGSEDDAVPVYLADEVFTALRRLGKKVSYARYEGEDHWEGGWSYPNQVDSVNRILKWFDTHLKESSTP